MIGEHPPRPQSEILTVLKGQTEEYTTSDGVSRKLVKEGSGMVGLKEAKENKDWAGIFNHFIGTARIATFLAEKLRKIGEVVKPEEVLNTILVSHSGRRQFDEASWYPGDVENAEEKKAGGDTAITLELLEKAGISPTIIENVRAHGVGAAYPIEQMDTWEKKLALYADFRFSQSTMPLQERFADLLKRAVPAGRITKEQLDALQNWANQVEAEIFSKLDIKPENIKDNFPPQPRWERYLRRLYINDAEGEIFSMLSKMDQEISAQANEEERKAIIAKYEKEFSKNSWWGAYVRELYSGKKTPYEPKHKKEVGIGRAINFFRKLDEKRSNREKTHE